ncbi:hypothetical protein LCGC14_0995200 [marine sediment metagenome]|uniref:Uncharacterized protein n=1 Tax=marine sediment metagenome TaxID=412755 RepID=A0A0F9NR10_9ZZZZ
MRLWEVILYFKYDNGKRTKQRYIVMAIAPLRALELVFEKRSHFLKNTLGDLVNVQINYNEAEVLLYGD